MPTEFVDLANGNARASGIKSIKKNNAIGGQTIRINLDSTRDDLFLEAGFLGSLRNQR